MSPRVTPRKHSSDLNVSASVCVILGHHTEAVREDLNAYGEHYNLVTEWIGTTVAAAEKMTIPDSVDLPTTLSMTQGILLHT